ncbi:hypothetical protein ACOACO_05920 [Nocardioides sp. CPCC 205120]|uniref:hypothetical protein n=1 Tax=Nocardioides sp. CPCC 205120 TaxID=3406462 RepID=UPI003B5090C3
MTHRSATLVLATALLLGSAACSSGAEEAPRADEPTRSPSTPPRVDEERVSPPGLPDLPVLDGARGARSDLVGDACAPAAGSATDPAAAVPSVVTGELVNGGSDTADYLVVVSWTNATSDVLARGHQLAEGLAPGAAVPVEVAAELPDEVVACTVNVRRGEWAG